MITYKGFKKGLECRGYKFVPFENNVCEKAHTARYGFHSARNPLDTLTYYRDPANAEYWVCEVSGDIDEDAIDTKVASTVIRPFIRLELTQLLALGLAYTLHLRLLRPSAVAAVPAFVRTREFDEAEALWEAYLRQRGEPLYTAVYRGYVNTETGELSEDWSESI